MVRGDRREWQARALIELVDRRRRGAALGDFRRARAELKLKKRSKPTTTRSRADDRHLALCPAKGASAAAETHDLLTHAKAKLSSKGLDVIVANDVTRRGAGFGSDQNAATLIERDGRITDLPLKSKRELADDILNAAQRWLTPLKKR